NVDNTLWVTRSSISNCVARGVTFDVVAPNADVIAPIENVVTASMLDDITVSRLDTASRLMSHGRLNGKKRSAPSASRAVATPKRPYPTACHHSWRLKRFRTHSQ